MWIKKVLQYHDHNETTESTTMATGEDLRENESTANISENEVSCSESGREFGSSSFENSESRSVHECVRIGDDFDIGTDFDISASQSQVSSVDIKNLLSSSNTADEVKFRLIENRQPEMNFRFPAKLYKDKRKESGFMKSFVAEIGSKCSILLHTLVLMMACIV
jgi:hypothetical protein